MDKHSDDRFATKLFNYGTMHSGRWTIDSFFVFNEMH